MWARTETSQLRTFQIIPKNMPQVSGATRNTFLDCSLQGMLHMLICELAACLHCFDRDQNFSCSQLDFVSFSAPVASDFKSANVPIRDRSERLRTTLSPSLREDEVEMVHNTAISNILESLVQLWRFPSEVGC